MNQGAVGQPDAKAIAHRLIVVSQGFEFKAVAGAVVIGKDRDGAGGN